MIMYLNINMNIISREEKIITQEQKKYMGIIKDLQIHKKKSPFSDVYFICKSNIIDNIVQHRYINKLVKKEFPEAYYEIIFFSLLLIAGIDKYKESNIKYYCLHQIFCNNKVCILMTGVPRLYKFTSSKLFENVINYNKNIEFDIIMCIQLENIKDSKNSLYDKYRNGKYDYTDIINTYKPKKCIIMNEGYQYDKLYKCIKSKNEYEKEKNITYDLIIKLRFETYFFDKLILDQFMNIDDKTIIVECEVIKDNKLAIEEYNYTYGYINKLMSEIIYIDFIRNNSAKLNITNGIGNNFITTSKGINFIIELMDKINYKKLVFETNKNITHEVYLGIGMIMCNMKYIVNTLNENLAHLAVKPEACATIKEFTPEFQDIVKRLKYDGSF